MGKIVSLDGVCYNYHSPLAETAAVSGVTFSVEEGEIVSLIGPSGCGKSTVLSLISGLIKPLSGGVHLAADTKTGYMLQRDHLFEWRSIESNVRLGLEIGRVKTPENEVYADGLLRKYGLWEFRGHKPCQLSGGMRQRAALIRTLAAKPGLLLLDEPFSALDYQTRLYIGGEVARILREEGKTAVMVTHDISEAVSLSDRVLVFSKRPARLISEHRPSFPEAGKDPMKAREDPGFRRYFNDIWKELDVHA
jgi:NitT/TauT family transport system ATP-binding protein